jgi:cell division protein FtsA
MRERRNRPFAVIDIGTSLVRVGVFTRGMHSRVEVNALAESATNGMSKGIVISIEEVAASINHCLTQIQNHWKHSQSSGHPFAVDEAYVSLSGALIYSFQSNGIVALKKGLVTENDMERAINASREVLIPSEKEVLHVLPQSYTVDETFGILDPINMYGKRLEVQSHIITTTKSSLKNLEECLKKAGIQKTHFYLQSFAASEAALAPEEKKAGVLLINMGAGTTNLMLWKNNAVELSAVIPIGGNHFTNDLSIALNIPFSEAERVKIEYGKAFDERDEELKNHEEQYISVREIVRGQDKEIGLSFVSGVLQLRSEELVNNIFKRMSEKNLQSDIVSGVVLTGGAAKLKNLDKLIEKLLGCPVKVVGSQYSDISYQKSFVQDPANVTLLGMAKMCNQHQLENDLRLRFERGKLDLINKVNESFKKVFREIF